ncbi:MAG: hypothetical protein JST93_22020 [Acidobacteria bacterium]|nr:hypothetical protein [Acidobacteriota bacterium]
MLGLLTALHLLITPSQACVCLHTPPLRPCRAMQDVQIAFTGRVLSLDNLGDTLRARIRIDEALRGIPSNTQVDVYTSNSSCGISFQTGKAYFIETRRNNIGRLFTGGCGSYSTTIQDATEYIEALRTLNNPQSPVQIFGFATADPTDLRWKPLKATIPTPGIRLQLRSGEQHWESTTNAKGDYAFTGIPPGEFQLTASISGLAETYKHRTFSLTPGQCRDEAFITQPFASISGKLLDAAGNPVPRKPVHISAIPPTSNPQLFQNPASSDDGSFRFDNIPMGAYQLSFNTDQPPDQRDWAGTRNPYPLTISPPITLKNGESVENIEFRLLPIPTRKTIQGLVTTPDGTPAFARVTLFDPGFPPRKAQVDTVRTNSNGRFQLEVQQGRRYLIFAQSGTLPRTQHSGLIPHIFDSDTPLHLILSNDVLRINCKECLEYEVWESPLWKDRPPQ